MYHLVKVLRILFNIFGYDFTHVPVYSDGFLSTPGGIPESRFHCPWWVKPLLIFFSPSVYFAEAWGKNIAKWIQEGIEMGIKERDIAPIPPLKTTNFADTFSDKNGH